MTVRSLKRANDWPVQRVLNSARQTPKMGSRSVFAGIASFLRFVLIGLGIWAGHVIVSIMANSRLREVTQAVHDELGRSVRRVDSTVFRRANGLACHGIPLGGPRAGALRVVGEKPDVDWLFFSNGAGGIVSAGR